MLQPLLSNAPTVITSTNPLLSPVSLNQLHNQLITCIYANITRDPPPTEVAPWVVATDKPSASKNAGPIGASDKAEERLKREIMSIHARDRRRVKALKADPVSRTDSSLKDMQDYRYELAVKPVETGTQSANANIPKSNWDRKYVLPLAAETLDFPSQADMQARIEPICIDEGLTSAAQATVQSCAELMEQAAEAYIKTVLGELQIHSRSNGVDCIQTSQFRAQVRKEEQEIEAGVLSRSSAGLLPIEAEMAAKREPISKLDVRLALQINDSLLMQDRFLTERMAMADWPTLQDTDRDGDTLMGLNANGASVVLDDDVGMDDDDDDDVRQDWQGTSLAEHERLMNVLDECLAFA